MLLIGQHMALLTPDKKLLRRRISVWAGTRWTSCFSCRRRTWAASTGEGEEPDVFPKIRAALAEIRAENACLTVKDLAVNGNDLLALGYQGKAIGETLNACWKGCWTRRCQTSVRRCWTGQSRELRTTVISSE